MVLVLVVYTTVVIKEVLAVITRFDQCDLGCGMTLFWLCGYTLCISTSFKQMRRVGLMGYATISSVPPPGACGKSGTRVVHANMNVLQDGSKLNVTLTLLLRISAGKTSLLVNNAQRDSMQSDIRVLTARQARFQMESGQGSAPSAPRGNILTEGILVKAVHPVSSQTNHHR
jgi:hypothetical protein